MSIWKDSKLGWLVLTGILVGVFEFLSLTGTTFSKVFAIPFFSVVIFAVGHQTLLNGIKALSQLNFRSINLLMVIAVAGAFYMGEYPEAAVVIVLFNLAEHLEDLGIKKSRSSLNGLIQKMPKQVYLKGETNPKNVTDIIVGDLIVIKPFEMIPLDGVVTDGLSYVDESTITGEPVPQDKTVSDQVFAGTFNKSGRLEVKVTQTADSTAFAKIREMTFQALEHRAETHKFIEKFSQIYTPAVMGLATFWTLTTWLWWGRTFVEGFGESLSLLVIACPCALVISTPISIFSAIGNASSMGALIKGGRYLEALGGLKVLALDKTRTLTYGKPEVTDVIPFGKNTREDLLSCVAGLEFFSEHPLAQSIVDAANKENLTLHPSEGFESVVGKGAKANCLVCYDKHHCIGKLEFIIEEHHVPESVQEEIRKLQNQGKTVIVCSTDRGVKGIIALEDSLRPESAYFIASLKRLHVHPLMVTGDHAITAEAVAQKIGIDEVHAELLPQDKARLVTEKRKLYGVTGMVGDGVNDAPALASAHVGISMSTLSSDTAMEAASVVIMNNHLGTIPFLIHLGRKTLNVIKANTAFAIGIKLLVIGLSLGGLANLALAIFADVGVTLLVILNSLRLLKYQPRRA